MGDRNLHKIGALADHICEDFISLSGFSYMPGELLNSDLGRDMRLRLEK